MWIESVATEIGGKHADRGRKKWSECCAWSVCVCVCVRRGERLNTNATYESRNGKFSSLTPADHRLSCGMGAKIGLLFLSPPPEIRDDPIASSSPVRTLSSS